MKIIATILVVVLAIAACGGSDPIGEAVDAAADAPADAAVDAWAGWPLGHECAPLAAQCQEGLTCRIQGANDGVCLPVGSTAEGDICTTVTQCGPAMTCLPAELGRFRCAVVCDVTGTIGPLRCGARPCQPYWSDAVGRCQ